MHRAHKTHALPYTSARIWLFAGLVLVGLLLVNATGSEAKRASARAPAALSAPSAATATVADDFDLNADFSGNDGTYNWLGDWRELGEADGPGVGKLKIAQIGCVSGSCAVWEGNGASLTGIGISREADLGNAVTATLSFSYRRDVYANYGVVAHLDLSTDAGARWTTVASYTLSATDAAPVPQSLDISAYIAPSTRIRFITLGTPANRNRFSVDNVKITYRTGLPIGAISGRVWVDSNRNGIADGSEAGLNGVALALYASTCSARVEPPLRVTATNSDGSYWFPFLMGGAYCVRVDETAVSITYTTTTINQLVDITLRAQWPYASASFGYARVQAEDQLAVGAYAPCTDAGWLQAVAQVYSATITSQNPATCNYTVQVTPTKLTALQAAIAANPRTRHAGPDAWAHAAYTPNDPDYNNAELVYSPQQIHAEGAWDVTRGDPKVLVAVLDTGLDLSHPEFAGRVLAGYDFVNSDSDPSDDQHHGTHVTGILGAGINNGIGIAGIAGGVKLLPVKVLNAYASGWWSNLARGITWAVDQGARVVNLSVAGTSYSQALYDAVAYANSKGAVVVVAAGNNGTDLPAYPASFDNVVAVGAIDYDGARAFFSNYGPNVDVMAPGGAIWSTYPSGSYAYMSGTSMAAPHAAGVAALTLSVNPNLTPAQIKGLLQSTATDMDAPGVDALTGYGLINAQAAVAAVTPAVFVTPTTSLTATLAVDLNGNGLVDPGDTLRYIVTVANPGATALSNVVVSATVPIHTSYAISGTRLSGIPVRDDTLPKTTLPLDEGGLNIGTVAARDCSTVSFDVVVGQPPRGVYTIVGGATVQAGAGSQSFQVVISVAGTLLQAAVDKAGAQSGQSLTYTFTSIYLGSALLSSAVVTAAVPAGTSYMAGSANAGGTLVGGGNTPPVLTWNLGSTASAAVSRRALADFRVGNFTKSTATGNQVITHNLGVTPKAIILWTSGNSTGSPTAHYHYAQGFSDGTTSRSFAAASQDNVDPSNSGRRFANKALTLVQYDGSTTLAEADLAAWDATTLTLNWTTNTAGTDYTVHYLVIGGSGVNAKVLDWTMPLATGDKAVTGVGFQPDLVFHMHGGGALAGAAPTSVTHALSGLGVMNGAGQQWAIGWADGDRWNPARAARGQRTDATLFAVGLTGSTPATFAVGSYQSMNADGFTVNFSQVDTVAGRVASLALSGAPSKISSFNAATSAGNQAVTGVGFQPDALLLASTGLISGTTPAQTQARAHLGAGDGTTQGVSWIEGMHNIAPTDTRGVDKTDKIIAQTNGSDTITAEASLASLGSDGFTLNWTTNNAVAMEIFYLALTSTAIGNRLTATPTLATAGSLITVTQTLTASQSFTAVTPSALIITATNGVIATRLSGPTPISAAVGITGATFVWVYQTGAPAGAVGQLTFGADATGGGNSWLQAESNSVIVHPPLTFGVTVNYSTTVSAVVNTAYIQGVSLLPRSPSNTVQTTLQASIGDNVWADLDGDGSQDVGEPGLSGVQVCAAPRAGGPGGGCATTDPQGNYHIYGLTHGTQYTVSVNLTTAPSNYRPTTPTSLVRTATTAGVTDADFGLQALATLIGDYIWYDADADSVQDVGEPGIANVTLALYRDDGDGVFEPGPGLGRDTYVGSTVSDAAGVYALRAFGAGTYFVDVTDDNGLLAGLNHTVGPQSLAEPSPPITVNIGDTHRAADFGYVRPAGPGTAIIGDLVWVDGNRNGVHEIIEPTLIGVQVCATPVGGGAAICAVTHLDGRYLLLAPAGAYTVAPVAPPLDLTPSTVVPHVVIVAGGQQYLSADFGYSGGSAALGGTIWQELPIDDVTDGLYNPATEPGISNVSVNVIRDSNADGIWDVGEPIVATFSGPSGDYRVTSLLPGAYLAQVSDTLATLRRFAVTTPGPNPGQDFNNQRQPYAVTLNAGETDTTADFGYREYDATGQGELPDPGVIGDLVWYDARGDGVYTPAEGDQPIAGVTLALTQDGAAYATATTGGYGQYLFSDLPLGHTYAVQVTDAFGVLAGLIKTALGPNPGLTNNNQAQPYSVFLGLQRENRTADFGYTRSAAIGDRVYFDVNRNGAPDAGEPGIAGVTLDVYRQGVLVASATTDVVGIYTVIAPPDTYTITLAAAEWAPGGTLYRWTPTYTPTLPVVVGAGQAITTADFGLTLVSSYTVTQQLNTPDPLRIDRPISFTIRITNTGHTWLTALPLTDVYSPTYLTYGYGGVFASPDADDHVNDGTLTWTDALSVTRGGPGGLAPGASTAITVWFTGQADTETAGPRGAVNRATAAPQFDPDGATVLPGGVAQSNQEAAAYVRILSPTGVTVTGFRAMAEKEQVTLTWQTATEANILGFNILRWVSGGQMQGINGELILAENAGSNQGATYTFTDTPPAAGAYAYLLEVVRLDGRRVNSNSVAVRVGP